MIGLMGIKKDKGQTRFGESRYRVKETRNRLNEILKIVCIITFSLMKHDFNSKFSTLTKLFSDDPVIELV